MFCIKTYGQITDGDTNVVITTRYQPDVVETAKIEISPELNEPALNSPEYQYNFPSISYKPKSVYTPIDPIFLKPEKDELLFDNYIEVGGGNYLTSYLYARVYNTQNKYYSYGVNVMHHAANNSDNPQNALFSKNKINVYGLREKGDDLYTELDFNRNVIHYYGYLDKQTEYTKEDINQIYNDITAKAKWSRKKKRYNNQMNVMLNLFDNLVENENTLMVQNSFSKRIRSDIFSLDLGITYTQLFERADYNRFFVNLKPHYKFRYKKIDVDLGVNTNYFLDSNTNQIYIAPFGHFETDIIPKKIRVYVNGSGDLKQNTLKSLSYENLFLGNNTLYSNPYIWTFRTGMNGTFNKIVQLGIDIKHELIKDQYFFINDTNVLRNFVTISDDLNKTTLSGEIKIDLNKNITFNLLGNYYSYSPVNEIKAWHMPNYDLSFIAKSHIGNKIYVTVSYFMTSTREATNLRGYQQTLNAINDINFAFEYRYKSNISGFLHFNNILNNRYEIWNHYRSQGLNLLAGITFSL
jgi:hypothetical protein